MLLRSLVASVPTGCPLHTKATGSSIFGPIARPVADILGALYSVVPNYAVAILILSVVWMVLISPLTLKSTRSMLAMQKLQPEMKKLQAEHKNDRQALSQATMDLYKEHGVSPFGSCLPMLLPLPVFFALFQVIDGLSAKTTVHVGGRAIRCPSPNYLSPHTAMYQAIRNADGHINAFGLDLSRNLLSSHSTLLDALPYAILLLVMIGTQYLQTARMMSRNPAAADNPQAKLMKYLPLIFGVIFIRFPAGVILYYAMSNICRVAQQELMYLFDPKVRELATKELKEVTTEIDEIERGQRRRDRTTTAEPPKPSRFRDRLNDLRDQAQAQREAATAASPGTKGRPTPKRSEAQQRPAPTKAKQPQAKQPQAARPAPPAKAGVGNRPARKVGDPSRNNGAATGTSVARGGGGSGNGTGSDQGTSNGGPASKPGRQGGPRPVAGRTGATGARPNGQPPKRRRGR